MENISINSSNLAKIIQLKVEPYKGISQETLNLSGGHLTALHVIKDYIKDNIMTQYITSIKAMQLYVFCG